MQISGCDFLPAGGLAGRRLQDRGGLWGDTRATPVTFAALWAMGHLLWEGWLHSLFMECWGWERTEKAEPFGEKWEGGKLFYSGEPENPKCSLVTVL